MAAGSEVGAVKLAHAECGTRSGYNRHRLDGEPACADCKHALAIYFRRYRARGPRRRPLPTPNTFARCDRGCGRLVWDFDSGLCGVCS